MLYPQDTPQFESGERKDAAGGMEGAAPSVPWIQDGNRALPSHCEA